MRAIAILRKPSDPAAPSVARRFLSWARQADADKRADAASALARAYLCCDLTEAQRDDVAVAMTALLDDSCVAVRRALAEALAGAADAPRRLAVALANDQSEVAAPLLARSPLLTDAELVDCAAIGDIVAQCAIARRRGLGPGPAAALAETGGREAALALLGNCDAQLTPGSLRRIVERFGDDEETRQAVFGHPFAPADLKADIAIASAKSIAVSAASRGPASLERAERIGLESRDRALAAIGAACEGEERADLVRLLRERGALTIALLLRSLLGGDREFFNAALAELAGLPHPRAAAFARDFPGQGFAALALRAGLPRHAIAAFRAALDAIETLGPAGPTGLKLRLVDQATAACEARRNPKLAPILALLWRFAAEAARAQARETARSAAEAPRLPPGLVFSPPANDHAAPPLLSVQADAKARLVAPYRVAALAGPRDEPEPGFPLPALPAALNPAA